MSNRLEEIAERIEDLKTNPTYGRDCKPITTIEIELEDLQDLKERLEACIFTLRLCECGDGHQVSPKRPCCHARDLLKELANGK